MKKITLPCSAEAQALIIGNWGWNGFGQYVKLLQIIQKLPDQQLPKDRLQHIIDVHGMEQLVIEGLLSNRALFAEDMTRYMAVEEKVINKKNVDKKEPELPPQHKLQLYVINGDGLIKFDRVKTLEKQLSVEECEALIAEFPKQLIKETLLGMEDWGPLTAPKSQRGKSSVYRTLLIWCRKAIKDGWKPKAVAAVA